MSRDRLDDLWTRLLSEGTLPPSEEKELLQALSSSDDEMRSQLLDDEEVHRELSALARADRDEEDFTRSLTRRLAVDGEATQFLKKIETRIAEGTRAPRVRTRPSRGGSGGSADRAWGFGLLAAGVLVAVFLMATLPTSGPAPSGPGDAEVARSRERREREQSARAERLRLEKELEAKEEERRKIEEERKRTDDQNKLAELRLRQADLERVAADFRTKVEAARRKEQQAADAPANPEPEPRAAPLEEKPSTQAAIARMEQVRGEVFVLSADGKRPARANADLLAGQGLETAEGQARVVFSFGDRTSVELGRDTLIRELKAAGGKRVLLERGLVNATVARQAPGQPMIFATPQGEATVLGTTLRIIADPNSTRLEVTEGRVLLKNLAGKTVEVQSGSYAVAAAGVELTAKPLPIDTILLLPADGHWGSDWKRVEDPDASTGSALEALNGPKFADSPARIKAQTLGYIEFTFPAEARKDYFVWIRGSSPVVQTYDAVGLHCPGGQFTPVEPALTRNAGLPLALFSGFSAGRGYSWIGGGSPQATGVLTRAEGPTTVRFANPGRQKLRIYPVDTSVRIDAVWLSATQRTRPGPQEHGPRASGK